MAFLILNEAVCFTGGARASTDKHSTVGGRAPLHSPQKSPSHSDQRNVWGSEPMQLWLLLEFSLAGVFALRMGTPQLTE